MMNAVAVLLVVVMVMAISSGHDVEKRRIIAGDNDLSTYEIRYEVSLTNRPGHSTIHIVIYIYHYDYI